MKTSIVYLALAVGIVLGGCETQHRIEADTVHRVEVAPVHVTVDVNIKVQRELDELFAYEEDYQ